MKNGSVVRVALFLLIMGVVCGLTPISIQASTTNPAITITNVPAGDASSSGGKIPMALNKINEQLRNGHGWSTNSNTATEFLSYYYNNSAKSCTITVNMTQYKKLDNKLQQETMQIALDGIYNSDISRTIKNKVYNEICALDETTAALVRELSNDVTADFAKAYMWFKPFSGVIGWILGVISLGMFILLGLTVTVDIAYIALPVIQMVLNEEGKDKAKFVSYEAYKAVKEQQSKSGTEYVSPMVVYMKLKTVQFVAIFVCLLYLVSGQIYLLLGSMMDYFRGILG